MERKILRASEGMMLTNGDVYGTEIYLGENTDENSFKEIPFEEYKKLTMAEMPEII